MRWREFIEEESGRGSASRLNMVIGVVVGSFTVIWLTVKDNIGGEIFATYLFATGGVYGFGKWRESVVQTEKIRADSPNQPPVIVPPVAQPNTVIQVGQQSSEVSAKDVSVKAEGNVSVNTRTKQRKR